MYRRDEREKPDDQLPGITSRRTVRRGRRYTPPGMRSRRTRADLLRRRSAVTIPVRIGEVAAELTPRQAVVWLINLETMISLYETTTEERLDNLTRNQLVRALRSIVRDHSLRK